MPRIVYLLSSCKVSPGVGTASQGAKRRCSITGLRGLVKLGRSFRDAVVRPRDISLRLRVESLAPAGLAHYRAPPDERLNMCSAQKGSNTP